MNQEAVLQSNLLDIIFENRNKDYGAYKLRKSYQSRLSIAVFVTVSLAISISLILLSQNSSAVFTPVHPAISIPDKKVSGFHTVTHPANKKIMMEHTTMKSVVKVDRPPLIVLATEINSLPATLPENHPSFTGASVSEMNLTSVEDGADEGGLDGNVASIKTKLPEPDKSIPVEVAEIMPQYPGGIQALLSFLKKNIHSPGNVDEGEDVTVKIEFVVNYNGNLESFIVVKSGGEIFDNEVVRVLKKMPLWIPGKSKGKNVSVYYTVPVKFTNEF